MWLNLREAVGWMLVLAGLIMIGVVMSLALNRQMTESLAVSIPATVVFRSGIGLIRLATSARCARAMVRDGNLP
jgi:hypothetical protein